MQNYKNTTMLISMTMMLKSIFTSNLESITMIKYTKIIDNEFYPYELRML